MDPTTGAVVITGLTTVGKPTVALVKSLIERVLGPAADAKGQALKEWIENRNHRAQQTVIDAATLLHNSGIEPQAVPGRILLPILEYSSVQDEPALRKKWAALLANAARPDASKPRIIPAFSEILRQLTPDHARILDWMYGMEIDITPDGLSKTWPDVARAEIENTFKLSPADYALLITDMERLQLIEPRRDIPVMDDDNVEIDGDQVLALAVARWNSRVKYDSIGFTSLGLHFIQACLPPKAVGK